MRIRGVVIRIRGLPLQGYAMYFRQSSNHAGGILSGRGEDSAEQHLGVGGVTLAKAIEQVVVGRAQREKPVAGVHHPLDEGPDSGQGLVVGPSGEPAFAKVITNEAQTVLGQFAGQFTLKGADAASEGVYFTHHDGQLSRRLFTGAMRQIPIPDPGFPPSRE